MAKKEKQHEINVINFKHRDDKLLWELAKSAANAAGS